ncbi:SsgA family sporulation/cell division regulator [Streptomyces sp. NPDC005708]|uniref:SsgA family sporulation/cell division regulator n=1 Tax=Streptomyces sp. NPDC005708 TaxID=3154564 RepID=UPI0034024A8B
MQQESDTRGDCVRSCGHIVKTRVSVTCALRVELVMEDLPVILLSAALHYSITDPFAVQLILAPTETAVEWTFARDLLQAGIQQPSGIGDVEIWPARFPEEDTAASDLICINLKSSDDETLLRVSKAMTRTFLQQTYSMMPSGVEQSDIDSLCLILGEGLS